MKLNFHTILTLLFIFSAQLAEASYTYYPYCGCGIFAQASVDGIFVDEPDIGFYGDGTVQNAALAVYDPSFLTARAGASVGYTFTPSYLWPSFGKNLQLYASTSYFTCSQKKETIFLNQPIEYYAIDGSGIGGRLDPANMRILNTFRSRQWESHTDAMVVGTHEFCDDFVLFAAVGFGYIYRSQNYSSNLFNIDISANGLNNGTITEDLETYYRGVKVELALSKRFCQCFVVTIAPTFGIYNACSDFCGQQNWGDLGLPNISYSEKLTETSYQGAFRGAVMWDWWGYYVGADGFVDYLSYVPGLFNPRDDVDGPSRILKKNSIRYGGGLVIGRFF